MKTQIIIAVLTLFALNCGCNTEDTQNDIGGIQTYRYYLRLGVRDAYGIDKIKGIDHDESGVVHSGLYQWTWEPKEVVFCYPLRRIENEDCDYLILEAYFTQTYKPVIFTHKLTCSYVFGDNKEHTIVTYWQLHDIKANVKTCYRIEVDGKEFPVIQKPLQKYYNGVCDTEGFWVNLSVAQIVLE
jgi:hypothetical protein